jgi:hypothetical protein
MRTLPVALAYPQTWEMLTVSARLSAMTHWDPQAEMACAVYCLWIDGILHERPLRDAWADALASARRVADHGLLAPDTPGPSPLLEAFWDRLANIESIGYDDLQPTGYAAYALDCLEAAVWCCLKAEDAEEAIELAVNLAGESDTIGAVAGGVAGAYWGLAALPPRWTQYLGGRERITAVAQQLDELRRHHLVYATPGLPPFQYYRVAENLHAGRNPLTARDIRALAALGVTDFIDLRDDGEWRAPGRFGIEAVETIEALGLRRAAFPLAGGGLSPGSSLLQGKGIGLSSVLDDVYEYLKLTMANPDAHVYVHARAGRRRTAAVLAAYLAADSMMGYDEVIAHLGDQLMKSSGTRIDPDPALEQAVDSWLRSRS